MKKALLAVGLLIAAGIYFHDEVERFARRVAGVETAEYRGGSGVAGSVGTMGRSMSGTFSSVGNTLK